MSSGFHEGDYIWTVDGLYFAVKGSRHNDELVISTLRYIPDTTGDRIHNGKRYRRVYDIDSTTRFLEENYPEYINYIPWLGLRLQSVPTQKIEKIYKPTSKLQDVLAQPGSKLEEEIKQFVETLSEGSGVSSSSFGVSGSLLIGLETSESDIDLNVYGKEEGRRVYNALRHLRSDVRWVSPYDAESIEPILVSRWGDTGLDLEEFRAIECGKVLHGLVDGIDYFVRLLVDDDESTSTPMENATITATIKDASHSIYTPCTYKIENARIHGKKEYDIVELKSYRGKFTEQAKTGGRIRARGTLEKVTSKDSIYYRLILGGKGDYLVPV